MYYEVLRTSTTTTTAVAACALCTRRPLLLSCRRHAPGLRRRHAEAGLEYNRDQLVPWLQPQPYYSSCEAVMGLLFSLCRTTYCSSSSLLFVLVLNRLAWKLFTRENVGEKASRSSYVCTKRSRARSNFGIVLLHTVRYTPPSCFHEKRGGWELLE